MNSKLETMIPEDKMKITDTSNSPNAVYPSFWAECLLTLKGSVADRPISYCIDALGAAVAPAPVTGRLGNGTCGRSCGTEGNELNSSSSNPGDTVDAVLVDVEEA